MTNAAKTLLAEQGYDPAYGARPLKRLIQHRVQDELATRLLNGEFNAEDKVTIDTEGEKLLFKKA